MIGSADSKARLERVVAWLQERRRPICTWPKAARAALLEELRKTNESSAGTMKASVSAAREEAR